MKLEIKNLTQQYGSNLALSDFTVTFTEGVYGILEVDRVLKIVNLFKLETQRLKPFLVE